MSRITAVFDSQEHAERALDELRRMGAGGAGPNSYERGLGGEEGDAFADRPGFRVTVDEPDLADSTVIDVLQRHGGQLSNA